jgi:hypothetical protein
MERFLWHTASIARTATASPFTSLVTEALPEP